MFVHFDKSELPPVQSGGASVGGARVSRLPNVLETFEALEMDISNFSEEEERAGNFLVALPESDFTETDFSGNEDEELQL